jgi:hypothetical protein
MSAGLNAVISQIRTQFGNPDIDQHYDSSRMSTALKFSEENRTFLVSVSMEFDQDYGSGQLSVDLTQLGKILRTSKDGRAIVKTTGVSN